MTETDVEYTDADLGSVIQELLQVEIKLVITAITVEKRVADVGSALN